MCIKMGENELSTVKALMTMSLNAIIADVFNIDFEDIKPELSLKNDLGMDDAQEAELAACISDYFDGLTINLDKMNTIQKLFDVVVESEFKDIPDEAFQD